MSSPVARPLDRLITPNQLLERPLVTGAVSFDKFKAIEIDDAATAEYQDTARNLVRVAMLHPDGGLLENQPEFIDRARTVGWSRYKGQNGLHLNRPMLPQSIYGRALGLRATIPEGVPALQVAFDFDMTTRAITNTSLDLVRAQVENLDYQQMNARMRTELDDERSERARLLHEVAKRLHAPVDEFNNIPEAFAAQGTASVLNMASNRILSDTIDLHEVPLLFRGRGGNAYTNVKNRQQRDKLAALGISVWANIPDSLDGEADIINKSSPLRRFPDLANHLQIHRILTGRDPYYSLEEMGEIANEMSELIVVEREGVVHLTPRGTLSYDLPDNLAA